MTFITRVSRAAAFLVAVALGTSAAAFAAQAPGSASSLTYRTALTELYGSPYPVTGTLELSEKGGILRGYYRSDDNGQLIPVTGGRDGSNVWIDIGSHGSFKINGRYDGQKIVGSAVQPGSDVLKFVATPESGTMR